MLFDLSTGIAGAVLTFGSDRLTRRFRDLVDLTDFLDRYKIAVQTITGGEIDLTSAGGRMKARMLGTVAAYESELRSERVKGKMLELAEAGLFSGGQRPFGFEPDGVTLREDEARYVRDWAIDILDGKTLADVARAANQAELLTANGKTWSPSTVRQVLIAPRSAGLRQHQGQVIGDAVWDGLIDYGTWLNVKAILTDPSRKHRQHVKYLLTGFLFGPDGTILRGGPASNPDGSTRRVYQTRGGKPGVKIDADIIEEAVEIAVLDATDKTAFIKPKGKRVEVDTAALDKAQSELDMIYAAKDAGELPLADFLRLVPEYRAKLDGAKAEVESATPVAGPPPKLYEWLAKRGALRKVWEADALSFEDKREVLSYVLDAVEVGPSQGRTFNPERLSWRFKV
jgi:DNA invertase Pin-like site-specific DNA recombinase